MVSTLDNLLLVLACLSGVNYVARGATTPAAPPEPTHCDLKADYVMILDRSGSIRLELLTQIPASNDEAKGFKYVLEFMSDVVDGFTIGTDASLFGAVTFAGQATVGFMLDKHTLKNNLDTAIRDLEAAFDGGRTNIAAGFEKACEVVEDDGNRAGVPDVAVLITDGYPTVQINQTMNRIDALKSKGVAVFAVGIGYDVRLTDLEAYASSPDMAVLLDDLNALDSFKDNLRKGLCAAANITDQCVQWKDYDEDGYGYIGDAHDCSKYFICKFNDKRGVGKKLFSMTCPPGTMYNKRRANLGVPCVHIASDDKCINDGNGSDDATLSCPYTTSTTNPSQFGIINADGDLVHIQLCANGAVFLDGDDQCRCDDKPSDCKCILFIDFVGNVSDHSCNKAYVYNHDPKVSLKPDIMGDAGSFRGLKPKSKNGAHLSTYVMNGIFSTVCDAQHGQTQLTVALWFKSKYSGDNTNKISSLVSYCDVKNDRALYIEIQRDVVCAGLKTLSRAIVELCANHTIITGDWYYVSLVYGEPNLDLYVTTEADYPTCGKSGQGDTCVVSATKPQSGCVEPRSGGLDIGAGGDSWEDDHFFVGRMDNVQVWREANYWACSSPLP